MTLCNELGALGVSFEEIYMDTSAGLTEARCRGVFSRSAPVLQVGTETIESDRLFKGDSINREFVEALVR